jgi:hypothetical protein
LSPDPRLESRAAKATIAGTIIAAVALVIAMIQLIVPGGILGRRGAPANPSVSVGYSAPTLATSSTSSPTLETTPDSPTTDSSTATTLPEEPTTSEPPGAASQVDPCLVGRWQVLSHQEVVKVNPQLSVVVDGAGPSVLITPDGQETSMWPPTGATIFGRNLGHSVSITVWGSVISSISTSNGRYAYTPTQIDVRSAFYVDNVSVGDLFKPVQGEDSYTCNSSQAVFTDKDRLRIVMERL